MKTTEPIQTRQGLWLSVLVLIGMLGAHRARAQQVLTVTSSEDGVPGSLRAAISTVTAPPPGAPPAIINFAPALFCHTIYLTNELEIGQSLTLNGLGPAFLALDGNYDPDNGRSDNHRILHVLPGTTVTISNLSMIHAHLLVVPFAEGGAIYNEGTLSLISCGLDKNTAHGVVLLSGSATAGGAISTCGSVTLMNCSLTGNSAYSPGSGGMAVGGAIAVCEGGSLAMVNCTVSGNLAYGNDAAGGGIFANGGLKIVNCTISSNSASGGLQPSGGGLLAQADPSDIILRNSIIAANSGAFGPDVQANVTSQGHNLIGITNDSIGWIDSDLLGGISSDNFPEDPKLGPLRFNGGQTRCHELRSGSPAIDHGDDSVLNPPLNLTTDQRGCPESGTCYPRKTGAHVDIGAFEYGTPVTYPFFACATLPEFPHSLREILAEISDGDTMNFGPDITGTYVTDGELVVDKSIDIVGPGAAVLTLSGDGSNRVFHVTSNATVNISGLTIANGISTNGGGILNEGTLQVSDCVIASNQAASGFGGGIYSSGNLTVSGSTFLSNNAFFGGGLANAGVLNVFNSTFTSNSAVSKGGAVYQFGSSALLRSCTVASNAAFDGGGGLGCDIGSAVPDLQNCLVAGNIGFVPDAYGIFHSLGYNLIGVADPDFTAGFGTNGDQLGTPNFPIDAHLGPLQDNGGPTPTMALLAGSPAINFGYSPSLRLDQRGGPRPVYATAKLATGDGSDIGAYERDSLLRITGIDPPTSSGIRLSFWTEPGSSYRIEQSPTLWPGTWTSLTDYVAGAGGVEQVFDADSTQPQRFYRVRLLP